jgi:hypothetical protein
MAHCAFSLASFEVEIVISVVQCHVAIAGR